MTVLKMGSVIDTLYLRSYMNLYLRYPYISSPTAMKFIIKDFHIIPSRNFVSFKNHNFLKGVNKTKTCILHPIWKNIGTGYAYKN